MADEFQDPLQCVIQLRQTLSADKLSVGFFLGAGCPCAVRIPNESGDGNRPIIPDIKGLTAQVHATIGASGIDKPKKHYAVQLALYVDVLERLGHSAGRRGFIWDGHGRKVLYDLTAAQGRKSPQSLWDVYQVALSDSREILSKTTHSLPAYAGYCKQCHWYTARLDTLARADDLTLIPELGRSKRDAMHSHVASIAALAAVDPEAFVTGKGKTVFPGIGPDTLRKLQQRALLVHTKGKPYLRAPVTLPVADVELFFDIEHDPLTDFCYLHGFIERRNGDTTSEHYVRFLAEPPTAEQEARAFADAWAYMHQTQRSVIYYYSSYEPTTYRRLQARYPNVCTAEEIDRLFAGERCVDLYTDVIRGATEWPTRDHSIKTLAKHLGFEWRDKSPSGAASIRWYHDWLKTGDAAIRDRILLYNEDDCRATRVVLDGINALT